LPNSFKNLLKLLKSWQKQKDQIKTRLFLTKKITKKNLDKSLHMPKTPMLNLSVINKMWFKILVLVSSVNIYNLHQEFLIKQKVLVSLEVHLQAAKVGCKTDR
jgi:hypothetical protein